MLETHIIMLFINALCNWQSVCLYQYIRIHQMDNIHNIFNNLDSKLKDKSRSEEINVLYINNPDGSVRWIWPLKSKQPLFLKFYHVQGLKANLFAFIIPFIFRAGLQKFIFKSTKIKTVNPYILDAYNWALFTGTPGPNQKYILYQQNAVKGGGYFTKIGITFQSQSLINHEKSVIDSLSKKQNIYFDFPVVLHSDEHTVTFLENSISQFHPLIKESIHGVVNILFLYIL